MGPEHFDVVAVELQRADGWRYGYVTQDGDTMLVKSPEERDSPAFTPPDAGDALATLMSRKLRYRVPKAWAEFGFYVVLGLYVRRAARLRRTWSQSPSLRARSASLVTAGFVTLGLAPYVLTGYGEPLFQSLYSVSIESYTQQLVPVTGPIEPTISYTGFVQAVTAFGISQMQVAQVKISGDKTDDLFIFYNCLYSGNSRPLGTTTNINIRQNKAAAG